MASLLRMVHARRTRSVEVVDVSMYSTKLLHVVESWTTTNPSSENCPSLHKRPCASRRPWQSILIYIKRRSRISLNGNNYVRFSAISAVTNDGQNEYKWRLESNIIK